MDGMRQTGADPCESACISGFKLNVTALCEGIQALRESDPQYNDMSVEDIAEHIGISASTLKKLKRGEIADPRCSSVWLICSRLGLDARTLLGLPVEHVRPQEPHNAPLMDELRSRMDSMAKQSAVDDSRLVRLRELVLEKGEAMSRAESRCAELQSRVDQQAETLQQQECRLETKRRRIEQLGEEIGAHKATIEARDRTVRNLEAMHRRQRTLCHWLIAAACLFGLIAASVSSLFIWEITHIDEGITGMQMEAYLDAIQDKPED